MAATVIVNNLTVVHKDSGGSSIGAPDVCKTPTPGGPVPVPYVNTALSRHTAKGSRRVRVDGHPIMLKSSHFSTSTGDEPGTLGGVVSGKVKGKAYPRSYSHDVKVEGQSVFRFTDMMVQNSGSPANAAGVETQVNAAAAGTNADRAQLIEMRWSKPKLCCGDPVALAVKTDGADDGQVVQAVVVRTDLGRDYPMESIPVELRGDRGEAKWISRWRPGLNFKVTIPAVAVQGTLAGAARSVNGLEFRNPPDVGPTQIGPFPRRAPQYVFDKARKAWEKTGKSYEWDVCYEREITRGTLVIRRKMHFLRGPGVGPVSPSTWRQWKREIEGVWDHQFTFHRVGCRRGRTCECGRNGCCKYPLRIMAVQGAGHGAVALFAGAPLAINWGKPDLWWYSNTWWTERGETSPYVRAHEFGHLIGCYDEYAAGACHRSRIWTNAPNSIMNKGRGVFQRHVEEFRAWFAAQAGGVVGDVRPLRSE